MGTLTSRAFSSRQRGEAFLVKGGELNWLGKLYSYVLHEI